MKYIYLFISFFSSYFLVQSQTFIRSELDTPLSAPWEIEYGPDNFLWLTESGGNVIRVNPENGNKTVIYTAPDYFSGSPLEDSPLCLDLSIGSGTLGLALHPDFLDTSKSFIYFLYSYNSGTISVPKTKFRIKRLKWDPITSSVISDTNIVNLISNGYDHLGGRLMSIKQGNTAYLFLSIGDNGPSEENSPSCYSPQSTNPNNFTQDVNTQNGKIHRFNEDGSIPSDNPISNNSFYTRGHRNPQGLMYNPNLDLIYDIEHGDRTDDEINILHKGMNYGWKEVRGYHEDNSFPDEASYVTNYTPNPLVTNDSLVEPLFSWCNIQNTSSVWSDWCTVAPSGGTYYGSSGIPQWKNSLLVVTLKDGLTTDKEVYQFKLKTNGELVPSIPSKPNPAKFFGIDQSLNGRLRDIAVSKNGRSIYLINNGGTAKDKITIYTIDSSKNNSDNDSLLLAINLFPNPATNRLTINGLDNFSDLKNIQVLTTLGQPVNLKFDKDSITDISHLSQGVYFVSLQFENKNYILKFIKY